MTMKSGRLRGAIVGFGFISGKGHGPAYDVRQKLADDVTIAAVVDASPARRAEAARRYPHARLYADHRSMLEAERGNLDFVDICTPPAFHAAIALDALDAGLHVLCEKPLATSADEARAMLTRAEERRRVIFPCHNYKHAPVVRAVREVIDSGSIGDVHLVTLQTFRNIHARGVPEWRQDWRRERRFSGGGIAMDHGSHTFYLSFEWLRSYPTAISAQMSTLGSFDTEDDFSCSLVFPTGTASAHLSWNAGVRKVLYAIHGRRGAIRIEDDNMEVAIMQGGVGQAGSVTPTTWRFERRDIQSDWMDASHVTWFNSMFDEFKAAIAADDFVGQDAQESFLCVQLIQTAYASAQQGCKQLALGEGPAVSARPLGTHPFRSVAEIRSAS